MADARYLVTARKYRPQRFGEVVGQHHVAETLKNALRMDRLAHAYLFSGPRGVGKTTAARILAKAINCTTPLTDREDAEPCRTCTSCESFEAGRNLNIIEIDAASNNSVDDVRTLQEKVRIPPQGANKKVYIIDEVHMLSKPAFNALLKTLEEPPPHVLFIFATTEPHKVLPTILSRCQRFDFRRISVSDTLEHLREICTREAITAEEEALLLIARKGDGALRDALSVLDQAIALCGTDLRYTALAQALGVVDTDVYFNITELIQQQDRAGLLQAVDGLVQRGYDLQEFLIGLAEHVRHLLVAKTLNATDLIDTSTRYQARYLEVAQTFGETALLRMLHICAEAEAALKTAPQPRLKLEMALLHMATFAEALDLRTLLERLDEVEDLVRTMPANPPAFEAAPPPQIAEPPPPDFDIPPPAESSPQLAVSSEDASGKVEPEEIEPEMIAEEHEPVAEEPASSLPEPLPPAKPPLPSLEEATEPTPSDTALSLFGPPAIQKSSPAAPTTDEPTDLLMAGAHGALATLAPPDVDVHFGVSLQKVAAAWPTFIEQVKTDQIGLAALLTQAQPATVEQGVVHIHVPDAFHERSLRDQQETLHTTLVEIMEEEVKLRFVVHATAPTQETPTAPDSFEQLKQLRQSHPVVRIIMDQFGGEIVW